MTSIANQVTREAESLVKQAAGMILPGETVKAQMNRAAANLRYAVGHWRVRAAWNREAGCWSAAALEELRSRFQIWQAQQESRARANASSSMQALVELRSAYLALDPNEHSERIVAIDAAISAVRGQDNSMGADNRAVAVSLGRN